MHNRNQQISTPVELNDELENYFRNTSTSSIICSGLVFSKKNCKKRVAGVKEIFYPIQTTNLNRYFSAIRA